MAKPQVTSATLKRRRIALMCLAAIFIAVPTPFVLQYIESLQPKQTTHFRGIPIRFSKLSNIKVRYRKVSKIPITITRNSSANITVAYKNLSKIPITYRGGNQATSDPRFPRVYLQNTTFRVSPRMYNN